MQQENNGTITRLNGRRPTPQQRFMRAYDAQEDARQRMKDARTEYQRAMREVRAARAEMKSN